MKPFPEDPMGQHNRLMLAFNDDLLAGDWYSTRAKAVCEIAQQMRAMPSARAVALRVEPSSTVSTAPPLPSLSQGGSS